MNKAIFITGGAGFIGSNAADYFLRKGNQVVVFDNFSRKGSRINAEWLAHNHSKGLKIIVGDIVKNQKLLQEEIKRSDMALVKELEISMSEIMLESII